MPTRIECPYCRRVGLVRAERVFKGTGASTSYYCGACTRTWEKRDAPERTTVRARKEDIPPDPSKQS